MRKSSLEKKNRFDGSLRFGVKKFYEITGRAEQVNNGEEQKIFKHFGDPSTGLIKEENVKYRNCICGADDSKMLFVKNGFRFVVCNKCNFLYVNPILKEDILENFYRGEEGWFGVLQNPVQVEMDKLKFSYGLDMIEKFIKKGSLLDVGCGTCLFLELARRRGWDVNGIEFNSKGLDIAKAKRLNVVNADIDSPYFDDRRYDVITMWEVLEHLNNPRGILKRANVLLRKNGYIFILIPNKDSLINRMLRERSDSFTGHCHLNFFNAQVLKNLLKEEGFKVLEAETIISELSNAKNYLSYEDAYGGEAKESEDLSFLTPDFIHRNLLGCKLIALGSKVLE